MSPLGTPLPFQVGRPGGSGEGDSLSIGGYELSGGPGHGLESLGPRCDPARELGPSGDTFPFSLTEDGFLGSASSSIIFH